jgi:choloylglycine hydrolase
MVMINARGVNKIGAQVPDGERLKWQSTYGSITFNQYGKEFPTGGMNEKGLVIELMWLDETKYPEPDQRGALSELQWIQYQLDRSATIDDVIATDKTLRISKTSVPIHFLIADALGSAASIEFLDGKMVAHKGADLPLSVLTNSTYEHALQTSKAVKAADLNNSDQRFTTACNMVQQFEQKDLSQNSIDYAFSILNSVAQRDYTKWSIVYDITDRTVHFFTNQNKEHKSFSFKDFDFACTTTPKAFDMNSNATGTIAGLFKPLTSDQNRKLIQQSINESKSQVNIPDAYIDEAVNTYKTQSCSN